MSMYDVSFEDQRFNGKFFAYEPSPGCNDTNGKQFGDKVRQLKSTDGENRELLSAVFEGISDTDTPRVYYKIRLVLITPENFMRYIK